MKMNYDKIKDGIKRYASDGTAITAIYTPINAGLEVFFAGMSDEVSIKSRIYGAMLNYAFGGSLTKVVDGSRKKFNSVKGKTKFLHDAAFTTIAILGIRPLIYLASGETDIKKIAVGTLSISALGLLTGGPFGYFLDVFRDLTGVEESERTPKSIKFKSPKIKKGLAAALFGTSLLLTAGIYGATPDIKEIPKKEIVINTTSEDYKRRISLDNKFEELRC